jgi:hypothetical protein
MRALKNILGLLSIVVFVSVAGCGSNPASQIMCSSQMDCLHAGGMLFAPDASAMFLPQCCANVCVVQSVGCESGYRFLNATPLVGDCAPAPMCPAPPPDMTVIDLLQPTTD